MSTAAKLMMGLVVVAAVTAEVSGDRHRVGDRFAWNPNVNYSDWTKNKHFYVNDWLLFIYEKSLYNVLEVNETAYEKCEDQTFIQNITRGGRDVVQLKEARAYYFLSSGGYCWNGMKLAVLVEEPQAPTPSPAKNHSPPSSANDPFFLHFVCFLLAILVMFLY